MTPTARPLTSELLRERIALQFDKVIAEHGPIEEIIFEVIRCNGCGQTVNLMMTGGEPPDGWTAVGDFDHGWDDFCPHCAELRLMLLWLIGRTAGA